MIKIGSRNIYNFTDPYIIAEIGSNHNGDMNLAMKMIDAAVEKGVDAVKFQSWSNNSLVSKTEFDANEKYNDSKKKHFGSLKEMVEKYYLRPNQHILLKKYCDEKGITFCSTPFSYKEVDLLESLSVDFYKIASMDINNLKLINYIAKKGKPILLSTGMASFSEIEQAVKIIEETGNFQIIILHCISIYPPKMRDVNLNNIKMLQKYYPNYPVGFSDHSIGTSLSIAATTLGVSVIEKHFTIDKDLPGWDHDISANPEEIEFIVKETKKIVKAMGSFNRKISLDEENKKTKFRRSIVSARKITKGEQLQEKDLLFKRPGTHISPDKIEYVIGRKVNKTIEEDELISWDDFY